MMMMFWNISTSNGVSEKNNQIFFGLKMKFNMCNNQMVVFGVFQNKNKTELQLQILLTI